MKIRQYNITKLYINKKNKHLQIPSKVLFVTLEIVCSKEKPELFLLRIKKKKRCSINPNFSKNF